MTNNSKSFGCLGLLSAIFGGAEIAVYQSTSDLDQLLVVILVCWVRNVAFGRVRALLLVLEFCVSCRSVAT